MRVCMCVCVCVCACSIHACVYIHVHVHVLAHTVVAEWSLEAMGTVLYAVLTLASECLAL